MDDFAPLYMCYANYDLQLTSFTLLYLWTYLALDTLKACRELGPRRFDSQLL